VHARSVAAAAIDGVTGEVFRARHVSCLETAGVNVEGFAVPVMVLGAHFARESRAWWETARAAHALVVYVGPVAEIVAPDLE
jgi:hypothetical protein